MTSKTETMTGEEALSALMDGELDGPPRGRIVERLIEDPELRARWARYHVGRATMEGADPGLLDAGFSERVASAIHVEPVIMAPKSLRERIRERWGRPGVPIAAAAVVVMVAVGGLLMLRGAPFEEAAPVVAENRAGTGAMNAPSDDPAPLVSGTFGDGLAPGVQDRVRQRLTVYLNRHNRFADAGEMPNVMPSSRLVAFNAGP